MKKYFRFLALLFFALSLLGASPVEARDSNKISDWYIKDFQQKITVNKDSTMEVTEDITADCGNLPDKHGIFRVLPITADTGNEKIKNPLELISITDFSGKPIEYRQSKDKNTITWKIGDPDKTVKGVNYYRIKYKYKNIIRPQGGFDEFYWNLNGNFWQIEIDNFRSEITFPAGANEANSPVDYYTGYSGSKDKSLATYVWTEPSKLYIASTESLRRGEGITLSVSMPKNIFSPYEFTQQDNKLYMETSEYLQTYYPTLFWIVNLMGLPLIILVMILLTRFWRRFGKDPKGNDTLTPEFEIPEKLAPFEMGMIYSNNLMRNSYLAGGIINLAVKKIISVSELEKNILSGKDYSFKLIDKNPDTKLTVSEKAIVDVLFGTDRALGETKLSDLRNNFYKEYAKIKNTTQTDLVGRKLLDTTGRKFQIAYFLLGSALIVGSFFTMIAFPLLGICFAIIGVILFIFAFIMPKRTTEGWKLYQRIRGFKLYMETAEKYRQQFNEKENIFEKFLPYAVMFGITKKWINAMKNIYGEKYFAAYHPYWFYAASGASFDVDSLNSAISGISASIGTASGAGGSGGSGGGGGGGGGGGW